MIFQSDRPGGEGLNDLYISRRHNAKDNFGWQSPVALTDLNSPLNEQTPWGFSNESGGATLYFTSNRPGGVGNFDLYQSDWGDDGTFSPPTVVAGVNSVANDGLASVRRDGLELFLSSDRPGGVDGIDTWTATRSSQSSPWGLLVNLGDLNSTANDQRPAISWDGTVIIFTSNRPGGTGLFDLYEAVRDKGGNN